LNTRSVRIGAAAAALLAGLVLTGGAGGTTAGKAPSGAGKKKVRLLSGGIETLSPADHQCNHFGSLACPASSAAGELSNVDCRLDDGSYLDLVQFAGTAGQTVTIDMTSGAFDTYLYLLDPTPVAVASNDDLPGSTNSRIVFTLTRTGTWTIGATSLGANEFGAYSLTIQCAGATGPTPTPTPRPPPTPTPVVGACVSSATTLCLNGGRFRVQATFATPQGQSGSATAVPETSDTGSFWFFSASNLEVIVKVVDGCSFNRRFWVFAGGLTNVAVTMTVTDTVTGAVHTYTNPQGTPFAPIQDTNAFSVCP
jgi:pre-peptidase